MVAENSAYKNTARMMDFHSNYNEIPMEIDLLNGLKFRIVVGVIKLYFFNESIAYRTTLRLEEKGWVKRILF